MWSEVAHAYNSNTRAGGAGVAGQRQKDPWGSKTHLIGGLEASKKSCLKTGEQLSQGMISRSVLGLLMCAHAHTHTRTRMNNTQRHALTRKINSK